MHLAATVLLQPKNRSTGTLEINSHTTLTYSDHMNPSRYNVMLPLNGEIILFNMVTSALIIIDKDIQNVLTTGKGPSTVLDTLYSHGFFVDDDADERAVVKKYIDEDRHRIPHLWYRGVDLKKMEYLNLIITHECNLTCTYCYKKTDPCKGHMSNQVAQRSAAFAQKEIEKNDINTLFVSLYGGEPLVNRKVLDYALKELRTVCDQCGTTLTVKLFSNGTLLQKEFLEALSVNPIADIHLTFDAPESLHHQRRIYPDGKSSFDAVLRGAQLVEDMGINLILRINISPSNLDIVPFLQKLRDHNIKNAHLYLGMAEPRMDYCTHYYSTYGYPGSADVFCDVAHTAAKAGVHVLPPGIGLHFSMCASTLGYIHMVNVDGTVYPCMSLIGRPEHAVGVLQRDGTLSKTPVYSTWLSRTPLTIPQCKECILLPRCMGGCTAIAWREHHTYEAPGCFTVDFEKQLLNSRPVQEYLASKD